MYIYIYSTNSIQFLHRGSLLLVITGAVHDNRPDTPTGDDNAALCAGAFLHVLNHVVRNVGQVSRWFWRCNPRALFLTFLALFSTGPRPQVRASIVPLVHLLGGTARCRLRVVQEVMVLGIVPRARKHRTTTAKFRSGMKMSGTDWRWRSCSGGFSWWCPSS